MQELATTAEHRKPGPKPAGTVPKVRISTLVREACELLASDQCRTITDAAKTLKCSREHLSKQLSKPHVQDYLAQAAKREISSHIYRAARVKTALLNAESEKVRSEVASEIMGIGGIAAPKAGHQTNVNVAVSAGYIVDWRGAELMQPTIEVTAERVVSGGVSNIDG
jgi:hypothetical protein